MPEAKFKKTNYQSKKVLEPVKFASLSTLTNSILAVLSQLLTVFSK